MNADKNNTQGGADSALTGILRLQAALRKPWAEGLRWVLWSMVILLMGPFFHFLLNPHRGAGTRSEAMMAAKQITLALAAFKKDYGSFPNEETIAEVLKRHPEFKASLGKDSSNDFFKQLVVAGYLDDEELVKLQKQKYSFAYVVWESGVYLPYSAPLLITPLIPDQRVFDSKKLNGKAILARSDGSIETIRVIPDGRALIGGGKFFFDADHPHWAGKTPRIAWPE